MKKLILFLLIALSIPTVQSQSVGYTGKRFVLKTDVLNGRFLGFKNADIEITLLRKLSIVAGIRYHQGKYKQRFLERDTYFIADSYNLNGSYNINIQDNGEALPKATLKALTYKFQLRLYPNSYVSAPKGFFMYFGYEFGKATIIGAATLTPEPGTSSDYVFKPSISDQEIMDIKLSNLEFGWGYQEVLWEIMTLEFSMAITGTRFNSQGTPDSKRYTTAMARYYGPNILPFGKGDSDGSSLSPPGVSGGSGAYEGAFGFSTYIKVGLLMF